MLFIYFARLIFKNGECEVNKFFWGLVFTFVSFSLNSFAKSNCSCRHMPNSYKQIIEKKEYWWGDTIHYACDYECKLNGVEKRIRAEHNIWYLGKEEGNEYVCEGTIYQQKFSVSSNWWYWSYVGSKNFDPMKSKSKDLRLQVSNICE